MAIIVMKFGQSAVSTTDGMQQIVNKAIAAKKQGKQVVIITSTMSLLRQNLKELMKQITKAPNVQDEAAIFAACANQTASLVALKMRNEGLGAIAINPWKTPVTPVTKCEEAYINTIDVTMIEKYLKQNQIVIVYGHQYLDLESSLDGGQTETIAASLAIALQAGKLEVYSEMDGIYSGDRSVIKNAWKLEAISYDEILEMVSLGAKIIHPRAIELAKVYQLPIEIKSIYSEVAGTIIKEEVPLEKNLLIRGIAYEADIIRLTIGYNSYEEASLAEIFNVLAVNQINVDIIVQAVSDAVKPTISFTIAKEEFATALHVLEKNKAALGFNFADFEVGLAKVSIIGSSMVTNPGVAATMFSCLRKAHIPIKMVSTSEIKISVIVEQANMLRAAEVLHDTFQLAMQESF